LGCCTPRGDQDWHSFNASLNQRLTQEAASSLPGFHGTACLFNKAQSIGQMMRLENLNQSHLE